MKNNKTRKKPVCSTIFQEILALLKLSLSEIEKNYTDRPRRLLNYYKDDMTEKSFEIRFEQEQVTLSCTFDKKDICKDVYLFADNYTLIEKFVCFLEESYDFNFEKKKWILQDCDIEVKGIGRSLSDFCFVFTAL